MSVLQLHLNDRIERRRIRTRWGWVVVSLGLMAMAGYFLYPAAQTLTESELVAAAPAPPAPQTDVLPLARPVREVPDLPSAARTGQVGNLPHGKATIPPKPIREVAPVAAAGVRNRIEDEIPVYVTIRVGANGSVAGAEAPAPSDDIQAYLVQRTLEAVRQWKFRPARLGADAVPGKWTVRFQFDKSGVIWN